MSLFKIPKHCMPILFVMQFFKGMLFEIVDCSLTELLQRDARQALDVPDALYHSRQKEKPIIAAHTLALSNMKHRSTDQCICHSAAAWRCLTEGVGCQKGSRWGLSGREGTSLITSCTWLSSLHCSCAS